MILSWQPPSLTPHEFASSPDLSPLDRERLRGLILPVSCGRRDLERPPDHPLHCAEFLTQHRLRLLRATAHFASAEQLWSASHL
jgi:hypothetical protein